MAIFRRPSRPQIDQTSASDTHEDSAGQRVTRRIALLIVEENETAREVLARRLAHLDHDVTVAENGFVALSMMIARKFDLILVDMDMTMLSGAATLRKMRASGLIGRATLVSISGANDSALIIEAIKAGADDNVIKPFDFDVLDARIRLMVARAKQIADLADHNASLDARIARRAVELGETRAELAELRADRSRLVASIQTLHDELERISASGVS
jgi:DNA-binding response OmpR family regulator